LTLLTAITKDMKKAIFILYLFITPIFCFGQEQIFSLGYSKTFIKKDSSTLSLTLDLNRIPGQTNQPGGYYFKNDIIGTKGWGYYIKPTIDINIGSAISSSPNNISLGTAFGLAKDFKKTKVGIVSLYIEGLPQIVSDKSLKNSLYNVSIGPYVKYELINSKILLDILLGVSNANGVRDEYEGRINHYYGRVTIPLFLKFKCWDATDKKKQNDTQHQTQNEKQKEKHYQRISWTNSFEFNYVYSDDSKINVDKNYKYFNSKFDFYLIHNLALTIAYSNGKKEPMFKQNNSLTFGLTLAR
jgi:hypothetical protein